MRADRSLGPPRCGVAPVRLVLLALPFVIGACDWFTNFVEQPAIETWESVLGDSVPQRANPVNSMPMTGGDIPAYVVSYQPFPATLDSLAGVANPAPVTEASLLEGRMQYQLNCAVCHGPAGRGNGAVVPFGYPPIDLTSALTQGRSDGYLYGMIRNGRGIMPSYNRIDVRERWHLVNYVRALQGRVAIAVDTVPFGQPGETGAMLPGATGSAPTRPAPFLLSDSVARSLPPGASVPWLPPPTRPPSAQPPSTATPAPGGGE